MSNLEELYSRIALGQNMDEITQQILSIYDNPQSIFEVLRIISEQDNQLIRNQAAVQLRLALGKNWSKICQDPVVEQIKAAILEVLKKEPSILLRESIIHSMSLIIESKIQWPELSQYTQDLLQSSEPIQIETALKILFVWIPSFPKEEFLLMAPFIGQNIISALSTDSVDIQIDGFNLLAQSISFFDSQLVSPFSDALNRIFEVFHQMMIQQNDNAFKISRIIEHIIESNNNSININQLISIFLQLAQDGNISPNYYFTIFCPLSTLAEKCSLDQLKPFAGDIMKSTILCISKSLNDECFSEDSLGLYISYLIDSLIECMNNEKLFNVALSLLPDNSVNEAYAAAIVFNRFLEFSDSIAIKYSVELANRLLKYANSNCSHVVFEASLIALSKLISDADNKMSAFVDPIIKCCLEAFETHHEQLIINALQTLTNAIDNIEFDSSYLEILIPKITSLAASNNITITEYAIPVFSALTVKCENDIIPYIPSFLPLIVHAAQINEKNDPILKGEALETLAQIISVAPAESSSIIEPSMQLFMECTKTEDTTIIASLLKSFSFLVSAKFNGIESILPTIIQFSISQLDLGKTLNVITDENFNPYEEENTGTNIDIYESIMNALSVINSAAKSATEYLAPYIKEVTESVLSYTNLPDSQISRHSISYLATLIVTYHLTPNEYIYQLISEPYDLFQDYDEGNVAEMFLFCKTILENDCPVDPKFLELFYQYSLKAIEHKLPALKSYQRDNNNKYNEFNEEEDDADFDDDANDKSEFDIVEAVFELLSVLVSKRFFNSQTLTKLVSSLKNAQKKNFTLDVIYGTDILGQLFEVDQTSFSKLALKFSLNIIHDCLPLCDGTYRPCPLDATRRIISTNITVLNDIIPQIIEKTNSILALENQGQPFYKETLSSAVSLLFALFKIQGQEFPLNNYFPAMLSSLPSRYYANYIYGTLVILYLQAGEIFNPFANELIRVLAQTLCLKDNQLKKYNFSQEVYQNVLKMFMILIQTVPNAQELVQQVVPNPSSQEILQSRLAAASSQC